MTDETKKRAVALQRAAECRARAAQYQALADEAKQRGDTEMSSNFASSAAEEWVEARRIEEGLGAPGKQV
jgi:rubrerythrin